MREKIKKVFKNRIFIFALGVLLSGSVGVLAATYFPSDDVTYDNKTSGLKSTNVQGAIDELYNTCFPPTPSAGDQIIEDNGLEKYPYECRYFFIGENSNNYITFNGEKAGWRIISVECDGTIKIMNYKGLKNVLWSDTSAWDTNGSTNWSKPTSLNTYLNGTYYNNLISKSKSQIVSHDWSIGGISATNNDPAAQVNNEKNTIWNGKIALPTLSEYLRTNSNTNCQTISDYNENENHCVFNTWMYLNNNDYWWLLTPYIGSGGTSSTIYAYVSDASVMASYKPTTTFNLVRPTVYLSPDITLSGGSGTESDPYTIE